MRLSSKVIGPQRKTIKKRYNNNASYRSRGSAGVNVNNAMAPMFRLPRNFFGPKIHGIQASVTYSGVTSSTSTYQTANYFATLSQVGDYTSYQNIFDQYMIYKVDIRIVMTGNLGTPNAPALPNLISVIDYDDANALTSTSQALNYASKYIHTPGSNVVRSFRPKCQGGVLNTGATITRGLGLDAVWLDCAQPAVSHYGMKLIFETSPTTNQLCSFSAYATLYCLFRNTR